MRVLFLLTQSLEYPGGLGRIWPIARYMARLGYQVEIAAAHPAWNSIRTQCFTREGVSVSYVAQMHVFQDPRDGNRRHYFGPVKLLQVALAEMVSLSHAALRSRADIIHVAKAQPMNGFAGVLGARLAHRRLYLDYDDYEAGTNRFGSEWQKKVVSTFEDYLPRSVHGVTTSSTFLHDRCLKLGVRANRIRLVMNGFDPARFKPVPKEQIEKIRGQWNLGDRSTVLYLGSLSLSSHPILLLLDAFVEVRQRFPSASLLIVGGGEDYDEVAQAIQARGLDKAVILAGRVDPEVTAGIYAASHVLVDPVYDDIAGRSRTPIKIAEGMAMGIPIITGDVGDRRRMLAGGKAGVLVKPGDANALGEGILSVLKDREWQREMSNQSKMIAQQFGWDQLVRDFIRIYEQ